MKGRTIKLCTQKCRASATLDFSKMIVLTACTHKYKTQSVVLKRNLRKSHAIERSVGSRLTKSDDLQTDVFCFRTANLRISQNLTKCEEEAAQRQVRHDEFWRASQPTQETRDEADLSPELEWVCMGENQTETAATGSGGMSMDVTTLI